MLKLIVKQILNLTGYKLRKIPDTHSFERLIEPDSYRRLNQLFQYYQINHVLDVGAFEGQFANLLLNTFNYNGRLTSFEPVPQHYERLKYSAEPYKSRWETCNFALGDFCGSTTILIAGNAYSSSILPMRTVHEQVAPDSSYVGTQTIKIATLDSIISQYCQEDENIYLKVDVQGFEKKVLDGAASSLARIHTIQLELSLVELYDGETLLGEMILHMKDLGYKLVLLIPGFANAKTGELLQVDAVFHRDI